MSTPADASPPTDRASRYRRLPWGTLLVEAVFTVAAILLALAALYESQEELAQINQVMFEQIISPEVIGRGDYAVAMRLGAVFFADVLPLEQRLEHQYAVLRRRLPPVSDAEAAAIDSTRARP